MRQQASIAPNLAALAAVAAVPPTSLAGSAHSYAAASSAVDFRLLGIDSLLRYCRVHDISTPNGTIDRDALVSHVQAHFNGTLDVQHNSILEFIGAVVRRANR
jgi:Sin3 binding region of histone deacetylase complex subunit SAP30